MWCYGTRWLCGVMVLGWLCGVMVLGSYVVLWY